jgi:hypothetical protein
MHIQKNFNKQTVLVTFESMKIRNNIAEVY